jgi:hypothetical protein
MSKVIVIEFVSIDGVTARPPKPAAAGMTLVMADCDGTTGGTWPDGATGVLMRGARSAHGQHRGGGGYTLPRYVCSPLHGVMNASLIALGLLLAGGVLLTARC